MFQHQYSVTRYASHACESFALLNDDTRLAMVERREPQKENDQVVWAMRGQFSYSCYQIRYAENITALYADAQRVSSL
jgi:hypothetical protein